MHIENLKVFSDLVHSESFSKSAKLNGITQSAVSQQLRAMEKHYNILIVDRSQKQFRLTPEGKKLYAAAQRILAIAETLNGELQEMKNVVSGPINLSTIYSIGLHELPPYIKLFLKEYPAVNLRVEYRRSNHVYEDILQNSFDIGLVAFPVKTKGLEIIPFREDSLVLICHPDNPLATKSKVSLEEIAKRKFVSFDPDIPTRKGIDAMFREKRLTVDPVMEFDNIETVKRAVEIDAGVAIVPSATVRQEVARGALVAVDIDAKRRSRPLAILHRKGKVMTPALCKFIETLTTKLPESAVEVEPGPVPGKSRARGRRVGAA